MNSAQAETPVSAELLEVADLRVSFRAGGRQVHAVNGVSFAVNAGDTFGLVGESGSGKSATALSILRLLPPHSARILSGSIRLDGVDVVGAPEAQLRRLRGAVAGMIFQNPMNSLNPIMRVGEQIAEPLLVHRAAAPGDARRRALELLEKVRIREPARVMRMYPHELSGGMRQRVMIAMALALRPRLIIADEPTTALDPTIQEEVLALLRELIEQHRCALLLITHDLGVVARNARTVAVMYAGRIVEHAPAASLFRQPHHPYTAGLVASLPARWRRSEPISYIEGAPPDPAAPPVGCAFSPRCPRRLAVCSREEPPLRALAGASGGTVHRVACHNPVNTAPPPRPAGARA